jgi:hypothetical protein
MMNATPNDDARLFGIRREEAQAQILDVFAALEADDVRSARQDVEDRFVVRRPFRASS